MFFGSVRTWGSLQQTALARWTNRIVDVYVSAACYTHACVVRWWSVSVSVQWCGGRGTSDNGWACFSPANKPAGCAFPGAPLLWPATVCVGPPVACLHPRALGTASCSPANWHYAVALITCSTSGVIARIASPLTGSETSRVRLLTLFNFTSTLYSVEVYSFLKVQYRLQDLFPGVLQLFFFNFSWDGQ